jgi:hypothetical protein
LTDCSEQNARERDFAKQQQQKKKTKKETEVVEGTTDERPDECIRNKQTAAAST